MAVRMRNIPATLYMVTAITSADSTSMAHTAHTERK